MAIRLDVTSRWAGEVQFTAEIDCDVTASRSVKLGLAVQWGIKAGADLAGADLTGANLTRANLARADLADADLAGADLADANLTRADLAGANLAGADLTGANLARADLTGANLAGANLAGANLARADLEGADLTRADLTGANLAGAKGLTDKELRPIIADYWMILTRAQKEVPALIAALRGGIVDGSTYSGACACLVGTLENAGATGLPHVASSFAERWFSAIRKGDKPGDDSVGGFASEKALQWALEYCDFAGIELTTQAGD